MEQNKTILVVDDDAKIRLLLRRCLESDGYRVVEAETEAEVVQQLASNTVDLITLDLQLGAENGFAHRRQSAGNIQRAYRDGDRQRGCHRQGGWSGNWR